MSSMRIPSAVVAMAAVLVPGIALAEPLPIALPAPDSLGRIEVQIPRWPRNGHLELPWDGRALAAAHLTSEPRQYVYSWETKRRGQTLALDLRRVGEGPAPGTLTLELFTPDRQLADGRYQFPIQAAQVDRATNSTLAYSWEFQPSRPGTYLAEVIAGTAVPSGEVVEIGFGSESAASLLSLTGWKTRSIQTTVGRLRVDTTEPRRIYLRLGEGQKVYANLTGIVLRPTSEGGHLLAENPAGLIDLPMAESTVHGTKAYVDPASQSAADWSNPSDSFHWEFYVKSPGHFDATLSVANGHVAPADLRVTLNGRPVPLTSTKSTGSAPEVLEAEMDIPTPGDQRLEVHLARTPATGNIPIRGFQLRRASGIAAH